MSDKDLLNTVDAAWSVMDHKKNGKIERDEFYKW